MRFNLPHIIKKYNIDLDVSKIDSKIDPALTASIEY